MYVYVCVSICVHLNISDGLDFLLQRQYCVAWLACEDNIHKTSANTTRVSSTKKKRTSARSTAVETTNATVLGGQRQKACKGRFQVSGCVELWSPSAWITYGGCNSIDSQWRKIVWRCRLILTYIDIPSCRWRCLCA